jgi:hypothetical protein
MLHVGYCYRVEALVIFTFELYIYNRYRMSIATVRFFRISIHHRGSHHAETIQLQWCLSPFVITLDCISRVLSKDKIRTGSVKDDRDVKTLSTHGIPYECGTAYIADMKVVIHYGHSSSLFQKNFRIHSSNIYELVIELHAVILSLVSLRAEVVI